MSTSAKTSNPDTLQEHELPPSLRSVREDLLAALRMAVLGAWPEDESFHDAAQPEAIGEVVAGELHKHLVNARIGYLFRETVSKGGELKAAVASRVSGKLHHYSKLDFLVEVNWTAWRELTPAQRVALIDHELCHFGVEDTEAGTKHTILPHDVEEFSAIVQRWGLWQPALQTFGKVVNKQMNLFEQAASGTPVSIELADGTKGTLTFDPGEERKPDPSGLKELADREAEKSGPKLHRDGGVPAKPRKKGKK